MNRIHEPRVSLRRAHLYLCCLLSLGISASALAATKSTPPKAKAKAVATARGPEQFFVPEQSVDDHSLLLVWSKPEAYEQIVDYQVFMNGRPLGKVSENQRLSPIRSYVDNFYASDTNKVHVRISPHSYTVDGLKPATDYRFSVRGIRGDGKAAGMSETIKVRTSARPKVCDITKQGAVGDGTRVNTAEIQTTIDQCPAGGTVLVPQGTFKSGALFLKSDTTLELAEGATLLGSERAEDYPLERGYKLYAYSSTQRPPSLINAIDPVRQHFGVFSNIRIVGKGIIDGNGWKRQGTDSITDEAGRVLPQYIASNNRNFAQDGILAAAQMQQAIKEGMPAAAAYSQRRSSLVTLRGVNNIYMAGVTLRNPAFHGAMVLDSSHATVNGVRVETWDANNGDGLEFGSSDNVIVLNSFFDTGDDCVNFAAGTGASAEGQNPMQFAWIFNNYFRRGHGAVVMGSHTGAWIRNILAEDNIVNLTWTGLRAKSNNINGGGANMVVYRDSAHRNVEREAFILTLEYSDPNALLDYKPATTPGTFRDFLVQNNSLEFDNNWKPTPISQGGKPKAVVEFAPVSILGDPKNNTYIENIIFEDLILVNAPVMKVDGLRNGLFRNITFRGYKTEGMPWQVSNSPGTSMKDVKLEPATKNP